MLQQQSKLEKDIVRSLDRLKIVMKEMDVGPSIPAFFYSASLLNQYASLVGPDDVRSDLFADFKGLIEQFGKQDFSRINKNQQAIVDDILEIVDSELFIDCVRPDIYKSRGESMRHSYEELANQENEVVMAKNNYQFRVSPSAAQAAFRKNRQQIESPIKSQSASSVLNQFDELWQNVERSYRQHNIDEAFRSASEYAEKVGKKTQIPPGRQQLINTISEQYVQMAGFYEQFDKGGWKFDKEEKGITLEYKVFEQEKQIAIRIHGQFDIPMVQFLSIINEIDLMGEYVPFCYDCKELRVLSRNERIGTSKIYIPLLSDRETYFYGVGYDRIKETGSLFFYSKTINEDYAFMEKRNFKVPPQNQKYVRLEYKFFIVEYIPLTKQRAKIRLASKIDMKMNFLPMFILNKSARIFAFDYFKNILDRVATFKGSAWQQKVKQRPDVYEFFVKKIYSYQI